MRKRTFIYMKNIISDKIIQDIYFCPPKAQSHSHAKHLPLGDIHYLCFFFTTWHTFCMGALKNA